MLYWNSISSDNSAAGVAATEAGKWTGSDIADWTVQT